MNRELAQGFADGVDARLRCELQGRPAPCYLATHDPRQRPCEGRLERFHVIGRQRVRRALGDLFPWGAVGTEAWNDLADLIELAEWDDRNGLIACTHHHRRLDSHATPPLVVREGALPPQVIEFVTDWGLEAALEAKYPVF